MQKLFLTPKEISENVINSGVIKANLSTSRQLILGILAGSFIAFGAGGANMLSHSITNMGLAKLLAGLIFPTGLILVILAGAELFTGNCLMIMALAEKMITFKQLIKSWLVVYIGNFLGGLLIAYFIAKSGLLTGKLENYTINIALAKINLSFMQAFIRGLLCNWLVCLAVWVSFGADDFTGKIFAIFFPVCLFVISGFEHSIANMFYIPAAIFASNSITWPEMFNNLLPVTLGNITGGVFFVGIIYWYCYAKKFY